MKKILLILLLATVAPQLKAQDLWKNTHGYKLPEGLSKNHFNYKADSTIKFFSQPKSNGFTLNLPVPGSTTIYSNMPVLKTQGNDNMPVIKLGDPNVNYTLLVKKININPVGETPGQTP